MNSSKLLIKIDSYLYKNSRKSLNKGIIRKKGTKRINRVKLSKIKLSEDTQFIHELLFKYIKGEIKNINKKSKNNVNDNTNDKDKDKSNEKIKFGIAFFKDLWYDVGEAEPKTNKSLEMGEKL